MEEQQNWPELLALLERPAFTVERGRVSWVNQEALTRLVPRGQEIHALLKTGAEEYASLGNGSLCLSLQIGDSRQGAAVRRLSGGMDLFLLDQEADLAGLKQLALAARQLREPLGNAMMAAGQLFPELELSEAPGLQKQMSTMNQGLFQLLRIINNMADAEQYLTGNQPYREPTSMGSFFGEILEKSGALMGKAGVQLLYTPPHREGIGNLDRQKMERAVYNLLSNALRFTPKGGTIRVCLTLEGERAVLRIQDSGDGLHREIQQDLFNRYRRTPAVEDSRFGLGLGLLLVRQRSMAAHCSSAKPQREAPSQPCPSCGTCRPPAPSAPPWQAWTMPGAGITGWWSSLGSCPWRCMIPRISTNPRHWETAWEAKRPKIWREVTI